MEGWLEETQKERKKIGKLCVALTRVIKKKKDHSKKKEKNRKKWNRKKFKATRNGISSIRSDFSSLSKARYKKEKKGKSNKRRIITHTARENDVNSSGA